jgi:CelD/BcsL family acetyltransferase involved in cellulose biosynthesis
VAAEAPTVRVARSVEEVERLRPAWQTIRWGRIDADLDFYLAVVRGRQNVVRPHVVVLERGGAVAGMAVARVEEQKLASSVGYRAVYRPSVRSLTLVHGGVAGADSRETAEALLHELCGELARGAADVLNLPSLRADLPFHAAATNGATRLPRERSESRTHRRLRLPGSLDELLRANSSKTREGVERYRKRLRRDHGEKLAVEVLRVPGDAERIFRDLEAVAAKTYQHGLGVAFGDREEQRELTLLGLERGWFRAYVLYLEGVPVAFWPGYAYSGTFFIGTPGYDPRYAEYRVGQYLMTEMIDDLCRDEDVDYLDYGFGDSEYKRRFADESWEEADALLFAPTFKGRRIRAGRVAVSASVRVAKRLLGEERQARLKQGWRRRRSANSS